MTEFKSICFAKVNLTFLKCFLLKQTNKKQAGRNGQERGLRDGPLENLWGGGRAGEVQKKYSRKGKLNEKKIMHAN